MVDKLMLGRKQHASMFAKHHQHQFIKLETAKKTNKQFFTDRRTRTLMLF